MGGEDLYRKKSSPAPVSLNQKDSAEYAWWSFKGWRQTFAKEKEDFRLHCLFNTQEHLYKAGSPFQPHQAPSPGSRPTHTFCCLTPGHNHGGSAMRSVTLSPACPSDLRGAAWTCHEKPETMLFVKESQDEIRQNR